MVLSHAETCDVLRSLVSDEQIVAWTHRDCARAGVDIYTIVFHEGNDPQVVEWTQARVERWLRERQQQDFVLQSLGWLP